MSSKEQQTRERLRNARRVVIKIGSALLHDAPVAMPAMIADEIVKLTNERDLEAIVISSGAISLGTRMLGWNERPTAVPALQTAAAVGQGHLLDNWRHAFGAHGRLVGQVLLTHDDLSNRRRFLNARHALLELIGAGVVPIINENDTVAVEEIKYGDNDLLAALVANLVGAEALIMLTDVDALFDDHPEKGGQRISVVERVQDQAAPVAGGSSSGHGSGGMSSKVQAAKAAVDHGIVAVVAGGRERRILHRVLAGDDIGTLFITDKSVTSSWNHWLAYGSRPSGSLVITAGAQQRISGESASLLPDGVAEIIGDFGQGDVVSLLTEEKVEFARGLARFTSEEMKQLHRDQDADTGSTMGYKYLNEFVHCDDLALL